MAAIDTYRTQIRSAVRGLWSGVLDRGQFADAMRSTIRRGLRRAWTEGAATCGIEETELTEDELETLQAIIESEFDYIAGFAEAIQKQAKEDGKIASMFSRADLWVNRFRDVKNRAGLLACSDQKKEWELGPTEEHCRDCSKYNGRVYRGSTWLKYGILPQSYSLACRGFGCLCKLKATTKKLTRGKPPAMTG